MSRTTSVRLNEHFAEFVERQTASGRYASAEEVVEAGLALLEHWGQEDDLDQPDFGPEPVWSREAREEAILEGEESADPQEVDFRQLFEEVKSEAEAERVRRG